MFYREIKAKGIILEIILDDFDGEYLDIADQIDQHPNTNLVVFKNWQESDDIEYYLHEVQLAGKKAGLRGDGDKSKYEHLTVKA